MGWDRLAIGTRTWRTTIIADVVLYFLAGVSRAVALNGGGVWFALLIDLGLLITTVFRVVVGQHWRNGPAEAVSLGTAYLTLAVVSLVATVLAGVENFAGESSLWGLVSMGVGVGMIFVALALHRRAAKVVSAVDATTVGTLRTYLLVLMLAGLVCVAVPMLALFVVLGYLAWLNRLTILLKSLATDYGKQTTMVDVFD